MAKKKKNIQSEDENVDLQELEKQDDEKNNSQEENQQSEDENVLGL
jgi:hypothetical protein